MKIKKILFTILLMLTVLLSFQNLCYADEIVLSGYDMVGEPLIIVLIMDAIAIIVSFTLNFVNKKNDNIITITFVFIGIILLLIYNSLYLDDEYYLSFFSNTNIMYILFMMVLVVLTICFHKKPKVFKILLIISLIISIFTIPFDKLRSYLSEDDYCDAYYSLSDLEIDKYNESFMKYEGNCSYEKVIGLIGLLKSNFSNNYEQRLKIPFVNYISDEKTQYMITELEEDNLVYYASKRNEKKFKNNSLYYLYYPEYHYSFYKQYYEDSETGEYIIFLNEIEDSLEEGKNYNIEIQQMTCLKNYNKPIKFDVVHVINIYEQ